MAETDILNPNAGYDPAFGDSMNPNYGWQRTRPSSLAIAKPAFGRPWARETSNVGHTFQLTYTRRNLQVTNRLKQFFEQFEAGFFTLIDHDINRHYVGRFSGEMPQSIEANGRFTSSGWTFEEVPGCPMIEYPSDWDNWAVLQMPIDDFGDQLVATSGTWARPAAVVQDDGTSLVPRQLQNLTPTAGDFATHEYRGYGFRLWMLSGPQYGQATLFVDGVQVAAIDLYSADAQGETIVYENALMPLDIHRVKLVLTGAKNAAATGTGAVLDKFEVMR